MSYTREERNNMQSQQYSDSPETKHLTGPELQVVRLICEGKTSKRIAEELGVSFMTAVNLRMDIMQKMDSVRQAIRSGLIAA
jgi:DNA-binding CsgD family transcriptional regulator